MQEQVPRGSSGEVADATWRNLSRRTIEAQALEEHSELSLATLASDRSNFEERKQELNLTINSLLKLFGIEPSAWTEQIIKARTSRYGRENLSKEYIKARAEDRSAANFLFDYAYWALNIEDEDDGDGDASLLLQLSDGLCVELRCSGDHWTERSYLHPITGEKIQHFRNEELIMSLEDEHGELAQTEYEPAFELKCYARFSQASPEEATFYYQ